MNPEITLAVTSCGRHDLLERTVRSFARYCGGRIAETVIVEDGDQAAPTWLADVENIGPKTWIANGVRKAQIYSCDRLMAEVKTPYIFWCEDDWEFFRPGFIEESLEILESWPQILQVWLRDDSAHPVTTDPRFPFPIMQPEWSGGWSGFAFNPGLRRLSEYRKIGSYGRHVGYDARGVGELPLSRLYYGMGYVAAKIPAATKHIGGDPGRHVPWASSMPKVLIAIPACHRYEYGKLDSGIKRQTDDRIAAQRATWLKDAPAFATYVDYRFFYGRGAERAPESDEIFLDCPDDYPSLPHKMQAIYRWALARGYDYVYKCDDDTFVYLDRLLASGFEQFDYCGYISHEDKRGTYISGGPGYWLSKRALECLAAADVDHWAEDLWTGRVLGKNGISRHRDPRYLPGFAKHYVDLDALPKDHAYISFHACTPEMMTRLYEANPSPSFQFSDHAMGEPTRPKGTDRPSRESYQHFAATVSRASGANGANGAKTPRVLIGILSCHQRTPGPQAQRRTWLKDAVRLAIEYRFFLGATAQPKPFDPRRPQSAREQSEQIVRPLHDQIFLDVPDGYPQLPQKTRAMIRWAYDEGYDYLFKCDDDTYVRPERLLASGFEKYPYSGFVRTTSVFGRGSEVEHAQGGAGYWLSRELMALLLEYDTTMEGAEDINLARLLKRCHISPYHDARYRPDLLNVPTPGNEQISCHDCSVEDFYEIHSKFEFQPSAARPKGLSPELSVSETERVQPCES
jgi:hypothetical protein